MSTRIHSIARRLSALYLATLFCVSSFPIIYADSGMQLPSNENRGQLQALTFIGGNGYDTDFDGNRDDHVVRQTTDMFTRITEGAHVTDGRCSFGAAWCDYDDDGDPDLFVTNWWYSGFQTNCMYNNEGDGTFTQITGQPPADDGNSITAAWGDYDGDTDLDLLIANPGPGSNGATNWLYRNDGNGAFVRTDCAPLTTDVATSTTCAFADFDNDCDLDVLVSNHATLDTIGPQYYRNDGAYFTGLDDTVMGLLHDDGTFSLGHATDDEFFDLIQSRNVNNNVFYVNNGGAFARCENAISADSTKSFSWGDYDNDGDMDVCGGGYYSRSLVIYRNEGTGDLTRIEVDPYDTVFGVSRHPYWVDFDNDGDLDLHVIKQAFAYVGAPNALYINEGSGSFVPISNTILAYDTAASTSATWVDIDRDGDLDVYVTNTNFCNNMLFTNNGTGNNWISVACRGTNSNASGIGCRVRLKAQIFGQEIWQQRTISGDGIRGQAEMRAHFGLGDATIVDSIVVEWPGSSMVDCLTNIAINQYLTITETICGDANGDEAIHIGDAVHLVNYVFKGGPAPDPFCAGDANGDGDVNIADAVHLINYIFRDGPDPVEDCC